jgi:hypothetical protein
MSTRLLPVLLAVLICTLPAAADDPAATTPAAENTPAAGPVARINATAFGQLPVWYNGRVSNFDELARGILRTVSQEDSWLDGNGQPLVPAAWLLDLACGNDAWIAAPVVRYDHPAIAELLQIPGVETGDGSHLCSPRDVLPQIAALQDRLQVLQAASDENGQERQALQSFAARLQGLSALADVFDVPDTNNPDSIIASIERMRELQQNAMPYVLPPKLAGARWETLQIGVVADALGDQVGLEPNPATSLFLAILLAASEGDATTFDQAVADYATYVDSRQLAKSPFSFTVPKGWLEAGVNYGTDANWYSDTLTYGIAATSIYREIDGRSVGLHVHHFSGAVAPRERTINSWRMAELLAPVADAANAVEPLQVAGQDGWIVRLQSPTGLKNPDSALIGGAWSGEGQTFVFTCTGAADDISAASADVEQFLKSIRLGTGEEVSNWFLQATQNPPGPAEAFDNLTGIVTHENQVSILQGYAFGDQDSAARRGELESLLKSIQFREGKLNAASDSGEPTLPFTWELPASWTSIVTSSTTAMLRTDVQPQSIVWSLSVLHAETECDLPLLVNHWRQDMLLEPLDAEKMSEVLLEIDVGDAGTRCFIAEFRVPAVTPPAADATESPEPMDTE